MRIENDGQDVKHSQNITMPLANTQKMLCDGWQMREAGKGEWLNSTVPGTNFNTLLTHNIIEDPFYRDNEQHVQWVEERDWEYRLHFNFDKNNDPHSQVELVFEGLDTYADVYLNSTKILEANNMFVTWRVPCLALLQNGQNELHIKFESPISKALPIADATGITYPADNDKTPQKLSVFTRKAPYHYGWDWGPKLVTSGIWKPVWLHCWDKAKIIDTYFETTLLGEESARVTTHLEIQAVEKTDACFLIKSEALGPGVIEHPVSLQPGVNHVAIKFEVEQVKKWWPRGMGEQHLYQFSVEMHVSDVLRQATTSKVGFRQLEVADKPDAHGRAFYLEANGIPFFAKGANHIPIDSLLDRATPGRYRQLFEDIVAANMNTIRVWGGGIYEDDSFYELADEYGIVIWQDFMFACTLYPGDQPFLDAVAQEATQAIKRLRGHACLGLWCGNNEVEMGWGHWGWPERFGYSKDTLAWLYEDYQKLFHQLLPSLVKQHDPGRYYFSSSPMSNWDDLENFKSGDQHYWGVWHGEAPFEDFLQYVPRFMSEYGFQSFPLLPSVKRYTIAADHDIESPVMLAHQKHPRGNQLIKKYMMQEYREPNGFENMLYLSQMLQAKGIRMAIEAHRRAMPFCMGSLYWQLNDCWPVASWSGIDYYGRWKALHYHAKAAFAPLMLSFVKTENTLECHVASDLMHKVDTKLILTTQDFEGKIHFEKSIVLNIEPGKAAVAYAAPIATWQGEGNPEHIVVHALLESAEEVCTEAQYYFLPAKNLNLEPMNINYELEVESGYCTITLESKRLVMGLCLNIEGVEANFTDNFFDLLPNKPHKVSLALPDNIEQAALKLRLQSVNDASI